MTGKPDCKPWCKDHQTEFGENDCQTSFMIYDDGREEEVPPAPGSMEAFIQDGMPLEVSRITLTAWQNEEHKEPFMDLEFFEAGDDPMQSAIMHVKLDDIRTLHSRLAYILKDLS
ncbi:hypothetical protein MUG94_13290 [Arthrobacter gengyunqii]|uniref:Uncharacterized protein n=1 Tax=Arthrobacter gengyunqii TaxID=2886940 RepID=A0A9X1LYP9_9MICC|nr:hypothetical protein [Arthrobacter gengyunqii]MCC3268089.1 hypothetical protein [Arthrobacter gengyunqii]UOY95507.1 hypothetical protein MUG94_13290 [Arthrobacter gengyunqii]